MIGNPLTTSNVTRVVRPSQDCGTVDPTAQIITSSLSLQEGEVEIWAQVIYNACRSPQTVIVTCRSSCLVSFSHIYDLILLSF